LVGSFECVKTHGTTNPKFKDILSHIGKPKPCNLHKYIFFAAYRL